MDEHDEFDVKRAALSLWGKSADLGADRPHLLLQHLYDTLAVGELIWDEYLGRPTREALDAATGGRGREFFAFMCGIHDVGKATPKFQSKVQELAERVRSAGLTWRGVSGKRSAWHHTLAGARIVRDECQAAGWQRSATRWVWPLVGGHHGRVPTAAMTKPDRSSDNHGSTPEWRQTQRWILETIARAAGFADLADAAPTTTPPDGVQLAVSGSIIMADWLASSHEHFPPVDDSSAVSINSARVRAREAWTVFDLRSGILSHTIPDDLMRARFGSAARPLQEVTATIARSVAAPGLMIIEAPMGEGKTEAALMAAEILNERFGLRGVFVGMPTQATSDPMFHRVHEWAEQIAPDAPIMLLHGKRMFNAEFESLKTGTHVGPVYEDLDTLGDTGDELGLASRERVSAPVADWFLGRKRGLLAPLAIGTIDNLLHAGTRTPHVMLRHTGLAQKVVILDEVHAASVYMSQFMAESLRWLGSADTPVVVLTATLPPNLRSQLVAAYLNGTETSPPGVSVTGYPNVTAVGVSDGAAFAVSESAAPWREPLRVQIEIDGDDADDDAPAIADRLARLLADGGTALVIRNTVRSAQQTYQCLAERFGDDVELLHARLTVGERARRTEEELQVLGPGGLGPRPRHILVATQIAEQSFDVDADVLITDLAPIDLLLQRIGRIHRHDRGERSEPVAEPTVVVTGMYLGLDRPVFPYSSRMIYGEFMLLRAAAMVLAAAAGDGWSIPTDIPGLVERGYGPEPTEAETSWPDPMRDASAEHTEKQAMRAEEAKRFLLAPSRENLPGDLGGLHSRGSDVRDDEILDAIVRDGERSAEVVLVRRGEDGAEYTLSGRKLSDGGVLVHDEAAIEEAISSIVRLPVGRAHGGGTLAEVVAELPIPASWQDHNYLRFMHPLVLDENLTAEVGGRTFRYDHRLGLVEERP